MQRKWLTAVLCVACCCPAFGAEFPAADLAQAQLNLSAARSQLAEMQRNALRQLFAEGHASPLELEAATTRCLSAQADVDRWQMALARLADHSHLPVASGKRWLILSIPGLDRSDSAADYELAIPIKRHAEILSRLTRGEVASEAVSFGTARTQAVKQLCKRLADAKDNVNAEERHWAAARLRIAEATDQLRRLSGTGLWVSCERKSASGRLTTDHALRRRTLETVTAWRGDAVRHIQEAQQPWFRKYAAAIESAPQAFSVNERRWPPYQMARRDSTDPVAVPVTGALIPTATTSPRLHSASVLFGRTVRKADMDALLEKIEDHLVPLFAQQRNSGRMVQELEHRAQQVHDLALADEFFQEEGRWLDDHRKLAEARDRQLQSQLETLQLAREFVQGLRDENAPSRNSRLRNEGLPDIRPWRVSLNQLLKRRELQSERKVLDAERRLEERRLAALQTLHTEGLASWKEVTQTRVRIAELDIELRQLEAKSLDWRLARKYVVSFCRGLDEGQKTDIAALR